METPSSSSSYHRYTNNYQESMDNQSAVEFDQVSSSSSVDDIVAEVFARIAQRREYIAVDKEKVPTNNRYLSGTLTSIKGVDRHIHHIRKARSKLQMEEVVDVWSHATVTKAEIHQRYNGTNADVLEKSLRSNKAAPRGRSASQKMALTNMNK